MAEVVYLHVGVPKSGTTYLQDRLLANRDGLREQGYAYPVGFAPDMFGPAVDLIDRPWAGERERHRGAWDALAGRVRRTPGTAVVSHEVLAGATPDQVTRALADLGDADVHLVVTARDIARQVPAEWQETVKHQGGRSFKRFVAKVRRAERPGSPLWFWRVQSLPEVLDRWGSTLPPDRVHLVTVPQPGAPPGELWQRFCRALGLDADALPASAARANQSLGIDEVAVLRDLNRRLRRAGVDNDTYRTVVRGLLAHQVLADRPAARRVALPPRLHPWAGGIADEWVARIGRTGIEVVGDLDDLRPRPPADDWRPPDAARPRRVADATMDALVAVVMEAGERGRAAQAPVTGRLARAARRLVGLGGHG